MIPKKLIWLLGYNNLATILEQDHAHWLMKTDKQKQFQDKAGNIYQGQINNIGPDIIIESEKLPYVNDVTEDIKFTTSNVARVLEVTPSVFPHSATVNGLMFARITSVNANSDDSTIAHYKLVFNNVEKCIIPFAASNTTDEVYATSWIKTKTPPMMYIMDPSTGEYSIKKSVSFIDTVTNPVWYYPLNETLQPLDITSIRGGTYELEAVTDNGFIGYPLFWFTCDQTNVGPTVTFDDTNVNANKEQIFFVGNNGTSSPYSVMVFTNVDGNCDATPSGTGTERNKIVVHGNFNNTTADFNTELTDIVIVDEVSKQEYKINIGLDEGGSIKMCPVDWVYVDSTTYEIPMSYFDTNCLNQQESMNALIPIFEISLNQSIPFVKTTNDTGVAGIRMGTNPSSDIYDRYPMNLNRWSGLPTWLNDLNGVVPEHLAMYAFHKPPTYNPENPESLQGAGLIIDPGKFESDSNDNVGRVYILSNDDIDYRNNNNEDYPKPPRTAARICDIPTSVIQLTGSKGTTSDLIVDPRYVRSEASFTEQDQQRLYNSYSNRWVRPTMVNSNNIPIYEVDADPNKFAFKSYESLLKVDMLYHNDLRETINLNPKVDTSKVHLRAINDGGSGYKLNDIGVCIVGGYEFQYQVTAVNEGVVTDLVVMPIEGMDEINLANFDMDEGTGGVTVEYGTSPRSGTGTGLKFSFRIEYDYYQSILPQPGEIYSDLFALVRESDGLYVYNYEIDTDSHSFPKLGKWNKETKSKIAELSLSDGKNLSIKDAFMNSVVPSLRTIPVSMLSKAVRIEQLIAVSQTAACLNVIDKQKTPISPINPASGSAVPENVVDLNGFVADEVRVEYIPEGKVKNVTSVIERLKDIGELRYDSYVFWKFNNEGNVHDRKFTYITMYRSFNNSFSTFDTSLLPKNDHQAQAYINFNPNTTVVWNVEGFGPMMWIYDTSETIDEKYYFDTETMGLHVTRDPFDISKVKGLDLNEIMDSNGNLKYNVITNNIDINGNDEMHGIMGWTTSFPVSNVKPHGYWRLVFPQIDSFSITEDTTHQRWIPKRMNIIDGIIPNIGEVIDTNGNDVSMNSLIIDRSASVPSVKIYDRESKRWIKI